MDSSEREWMPVFSIIAQRRAVHAAHPEHKKALPASHEEDEIVRIGTAYREDDGAYVVSLTALPLNGQLLIRPRRPGDKPTASRKERRT
jgi:hypothetical protein